MLPPPFVPMEAPPTLLEPVGTGTFNSWQTVVEVVVGEALEAGVLEMAYVKSKLPLSVVALRADSTSCSAWPFPIRGCLPMPCPAVGLGVEPPATNATGTATTTKMRAAAPAIPARRHDRGCLEPRSDSSSSQSPSSPMATVPPVDERLPLRHLN